MKELHFNSKIASYEKLFPLGSSASTVTIVATDARQYFEIIVSFNGRENFLKYVGVYLYGSGKHSFTKVAGTYDLTITVDTVNKSFTINNAGAYARVLIKSYYPFTGSVI